ncbi:MAG: ABC transporter permease, partial [Candidatus Heimdallarchaeota archaeon]|nr:ABC transporter permease [Candidatus Heimdallarchaeota archaeon]MCK4253646.1 ABC transporter permease [Candidatus Heimdallarchaeota archaeon]
SGLKAVFIRNIKILWQYKFTIIVGFVNTFIAASLFYYVSLLVPQNTIAQDGYAVSSVSFIFAGAILVDISTKIMMKSMNSFTSEMRQGTFETLSCLPFGLKRYFVSEISFEVVYGLVISIVHYVPVFLIFPLFIGFNISWSSLLALLLLLICILIFFFSLSLLAANFTILVKRGREIAMVVVGLIHLLSGSLFPLDLFPQWLQVIAYFSPMTIAVRACRLCLFGNGMITSEIVWIAIMALLVSSALIIFLFNLTYKKIYNRIREKGTVHEF